MALHHTLVDRSHRPLATELGAITAVLVGVYLWHRVVLVLAGPLTAALGPSPVTMPLGGLATAGLFVVGVVAFGVAYTRARGIDVGLAGPTRADAFPLGLAVVIPVALVGVTKLAGALTGVPYSALAKTYYTADSPILPIVVLVVLGLVVNVPGLVVVCQVLVQRSLERVLAGDHAVVLTTLVAGFAMTSDTGGLDVVPELGKLVGAAAFVLVLGAALFVVERSGREGLRPLVYAPVLLFVALVAVSGVAEVDSVAGGLFALSQVGVVGVAAYAYDRSGSLLVPALAYLSSALGQFAVLVLEAGVLAR